jgi:L-lactate dehydrogenase complex protein LldE
MQMEVDIFIPCFIDQFYPQTGFNMIKVLEKLGCKVFYNTNQTCCGQPLYNAGYKNEAIKISKKFLNDFKGDRYIVSPSASCIAMVKNTYNEFYESSASRIKFKKIQVKAYEFTTFLTEILKVEDVGAEFDATVTYHDSCSAFRSLGIYEGPRRLLKNVKNLKLVEMKENDTCCGFGGTFSVKMEPISTGMVDQKIENALATKAEYIVSTDTSCIMHMEGFVKKQKKDIKLIHIADILAQGY